MARFHVGLTVGCPNKPEPRQYAFVRSLQGTTVRRGNDLLVHLELEADDAVAALAQARDLVLARLPCAFKSAHVVLLEGLVRPRGRIFRRKY